MRIHRALYPLLALALLAPAAAHAQERISVYRVGNRGMLGIMTEPVPANSFNARQRLVVNVVEDSPAAKAGVVKGDTLLSINGLAASQQAMNLPFEPGDTVVLRVRRDGRERDVTIVAVERTAEFAYSSVIPDSVGERIAGIMSRVRANIDTLTMPNIRIRSFENGDSTEAIIIEGDTVRTFTFPGPGYFRLHADSILLHADSIMRTFRYHELPRILGDSGAFRFYTSDGDSVHFTWSADSTDFIRPFDVFTSSASMGLRAVAGAELAPLNDELAQYFGAADGVLVLNARDGTPAARAGLRAGDVIVQVNGTAVDSIADVRRNIQRADGEVRLRVLRRGENIDITLDRE